MTNGLQIFKIVDHVQIGHLYEHIFCIELVKYFRSKGLYSYVDYNIDAKTYYKGYVRIDIELYTDEALKLTAEILNLKALLSSDNINAGLLQIMAENKADIKTIDDEKVLSLLDKYNILPWQKIDKLPNSLGITDKLASDPLVFSSRRARQFGILTQSIKLDKAYANGDGRELLPLFVLLSNVLRSNLQEDISDSSFCFTLEDKFTYNKKEIEDVNLYRIDKRQANELTSEADITQRLIKKMIKDELIDRIVRSAQAGRSSDAYPVIIDSKEVMYKVHVDTTQEQLRGIVSHANLLEILKHTSIVFKLGKSSSVIYF